MSKNEFTCDCTVVHEDTVALVRKAMCGDELCRRVSDFFKVFGDLTRFRILFALNTHEMCVCDLANVLSMTKSAVSHQLAILRTAALVKCRRDGKTVYYSLADDHVKQILETGIEHIEEE